MEIRNTQTVTYQPIDFNSFETQPDNDELTRQRLETLLALNAETLREKEMFSSDREKLEAELMTHPISSEKAFSHFGLLLGAIAPASLFIRFLLDSRGFRGEDLWVLGVLAIVNVVSAVVGFFSGKLISKIVINLENTSWTKMILALPFIGILWGILAGGAGGAIIFIIGAFFGAFLGALVGSFALPIFTIFHRLMKKGDQIERKHFLPLAFGITFIISAFMLGL
ncbi:hypothetical protein BH10ACI1_BH10ACI1_35660 [soil metagenome]